MKKLLLPLLGICVFASSSFALFTNGGFEDGNFNGWTLSKGTVPTGGGTIIWTAGDNGLNTIISSSSADLLGQTTHINPYNDTYMARLDNLEGLNHASKISQTDVITAADIDKNIYVNWGAVLVEPSNTHIPTDCPYFGIVVEKNGVVINNFTANATAHSTDPTWVDVGDHPNGIPSGYLSAGDEWYKQDTWNYDLSSFAVGDQITIEMFVADCSQGGHGGAAFLDGISTEYQPPSVPEPATCSLLAMSFLSLLGLSSLRKRK
jgi:hypothetical protein